MDFTAAIAKRPIGEGSAPDNLRQSVAMISPCAAMTNEWMFLP